MTRRLGAAMDVRFDRTVEEFMQDCRDLGLNHVELTTEYLEGHPDSPSPATVRECAARYEMSVTYHAPFRDWNLGSFNDASARAAVDQVKSTLDAAAIAGAGAVVVHGGDVPGRYPAHVRDQSAANAVDSLTACVEHAADVGVPLCLENQPVHPRRDRYTTGVDALARTLEAVDADPEWLRVTLDVGHASVNDTDWQEYVDRFGDRITVCHLHDNDGEDDAHEPLPEYSAIVEDVDADYNVFEMKAFDDIAACLGADR
jgi:sugar phosphate isomerase/epimerase